MVDHKILLQKLVDRFQFSPYACRLVINILSSRSQYTEVGDEISSALSLTCGVPQGSILGPLFFSMFINDLPLVLKDSKYHLYADDVQLYLSRPIGLIEDCACRLNEDLQRVHDWSIENKLLLNANKTVCMVVCNRDYTRSELPQLFIENQQLQYVSSVRNLGVYINSKMSCCDHVSACLKKIYGGLRQLRLSADMLSVAIKIKLVKTLLIPHFAYGSIVFPHLDASCLKKLKIALNDCVRFVYEIPRSSHVSPYVHTVFNFSLEEYFKFRILTFLHKLIYLREPQYLSADLSFT